MEKHVCHSCGHEFYVHCNYTTGLPRAEVYEGSYKSNGAIVAAKAYILLKQILTPCQHFQPSHLERQYMKSEPIWKLGFFNSLERSQVLDQASSKGLEIEFVLSPDA